MNAFFELVILTLRNPAAGLTALRARGLSMSDRWAMLVASGAISALLSWAATRTMSAPATGFAMLAAHPVSLATLQVLAAAMLAILLYRVGRAFGGTGTFPDALLAVGWLELTMLAVQLPQLLLAVISVDLAALAGVLTFLLYIYLAIEFTRAVHGFPNRLLIFMGMVGTVFVAGVVISIIAAMLGLTPAEMP